MVLATKKNCQRVLAAGLRVVSAMTGNPPLRFSYGPSIAQYKLVSHLKFKSALIK